MQIIAILLIILILIVILSTFYFYSVAFSRDNKLMAGNDDSSDNMEQLPTYEGEKWFGNQNFEDLYQITEDNLKLHAYYLSNGQSKKTAIIVHGYRAEPKWMGIYGMLFYGLGYNILLPDLRSHGKSEGETITFGWKEKNDIKNWIEILINKVGKESKIVLHGVSMGGATVMMTAGEELPSNVCGIIEDCGYSCLSEQLSHVMKIRFHLPTFPLIYTVSLLMRIRQGYFAAVVSSVEQIKKTKIPMLFIHGEKDNFVPFYMVSSIYKACRGGKKLLTVANAGHAKAIDVDREKYENAVIEFINEI